MGHPTFLRAMGALPAEQAWVDLPEHLKRELDEYLARRRLRWLAGKLEMDSDYGEPCIWLEPDGTCRHYDHRPLVCRDFEVGGEDCLRFRSEHGLTD
jgi:Fe-S-cluster containining protein